MKPIIILDDLLTKNGKLNSACVRRDWFKKTLIFKYVYDNSTELNVFADVDFVHRFWFIKNNMQLHNCQICGKPYIEFNHLQKAFALCTHKRHYVHGVSNLSLKTVKNKAKQLLITALENKNFSLTTEQFNEKLQFYITNKFASCNCTPANISFLHDLLLKTETALPINITNLKVAMRLYLCNNNLKNIPTCPYCDKPRVFNNSVHGFFQTCGKCVGNAFKEKFNNKSTLYIVNNIDTTKYDIIDLPTGAMVNTPLTIKCKKCNTISKIHLYNGKLKNINSIELCKNCKPISKPQNELSDFVSTLILDKIKTNDRQTIKPLELDIYIPDKQLAIEFDGLYWHSDRTTVNRNYHLNKTEFCEAQDIHLIHIFENEWLYKQDIVKSRIKNLLGIYDRTVGARVCQIKEVNDKTSKQFIDENHIQGQAISKVNLGLFYQDELVSLMTFSKPRFSKQYDWELVRFCNKLGYHIPGAAGKLLSYFEKSYSPKSLVSYADRRWSYSKKNVYQTLGFTLSHVSAPNYWYFKGIEFSSRIKYQKHKLAALLETFDPELSEIQNMMANGYNRIFDCGNLVYIKHYAV